MAADSPVLFFGPTESAWKEKPAWNEKCRGIRVFLYDVRRQHSASDRERWLCHEEHCHNLNWRSVCKPDQPDDDKASLEAGIILDVLRYSSGYGESKLAVAIQWDCGHEELLPEESWSRIRVFDLGPTGKCTCHAAAI